MGYCSQGKRNETHLLSYRPDDRCKIARWRPAGISVEIIAEKLGRHRSSIFREIKPRGY
jgi:IS30 family transposase